MTTYSWPTSPAFKPTAMSFGLKKAVLQSRSPYSGSLLTTDLVAERLVASISLPPCATFEAPAREAFFTRAAGGMHWVRLTHFLRPVPRGTLRGSPLVNGDHSRGNTELAITTTAGATLLAGDLISAGQLFIVAEDVTADGAGAMSVPLLNRVRGDIASGTSVVWNRPTATFILPADSVLVMYQPGYADSLAIDLEEVW